MKPRRIPSPIFGREWIPFGRLGDVARALPSPELCVFRLERVSGGRLGDEGYTLHRFPSVDALAAEMAEDARRCPAHMAGRGVRASEICQGWRHASRFLTVML